MVPAERSPAHITRYWQSEPPRIGLLLCRTRSRLKLHEGAQSLGISFDARFLKDTLSRRRLLLNCQRVLRRPLDHRRKTSILNMIAALRQTVERKGFEPSTLGLQSRCSPS